MARFYLALLSDSFHWILSRFCGHRRWFLHSSHRRRSRGAYFRERFFYRSMDDLAVAQDDMARRLPGFWGPAERGIARGGYQPAWTGVSVVDCLRVVWGMAG